MKDGFYDLCLEVAQEDITETFEFTEMLGWKGLGLVTDESGLAGLRGQLNVKGVDIAFGLKVEARKASDVPKRARQMRRKAELVIVKGGVPEVNRAALETAEVDILLTPWSREGCGLNQVLARLGQKNNVAVCFGFNELLYSYGKTRSNILANMQEAARIVKRFRCPFIISSSAAAPWDLRSPSELMSFGRVLGFRDPDIKKALSNSVVEENRKRLSGKWLMPGVEKA